MKKEKIDEIFTILAKYNKNPQTELKFVNDFTLLTAIILSAQATDVMVNRACEPLFKIVTTPRQMLDLGEDGLKKYINIIGLYNSKAKNVMKMSEALLENHDGKVPSNYEDLIKLAGVGSKTAKVFLNCFYGAPLIAVDTHVFRVANRTGIAKAKTIAQSEKKLAQNVPKKWLVKAHHLMILHGRYVCKARKPDCEKCVILQNCQQNGL